MNGIDKLEFANFFYYILINLSIRGLITQPDFVLFYHSMTSCNYIPFIPSPADDRFLIELVISRTRHWN